MESKRLRVSRRRGVVIVPVTICLVTLFLCAALAVDVGYICALTTEQQNKRHDQLEDFSHYRISTRFTLTSQTLGPFVPVTSYPNCHMVMLV